MRRLYLLLIGLGILVFLAISTLLARVFSTDGAERTAITGFVQAEASGNPPAMLSRLDGCRENPACRAQVAQLSLHAAPLRQRLDPPAGALDRVLADRHHRRRPRGLERFVGSRGRSCNAFGFAAPGTRSGGCGSSC